MKFLATTSAFLAVLLSVLTASAAPAPIGILSVTSVTFSGSGCPSGSTAVALHPSATAASIVYAQYFAEAGPGIPASENHKSCTAAITVQIPPGYKLGTAQVDTRAFAQLDTGVTASHQGAYYLDGLLVHATSRADIVGPVLPGSPYSYTDTFDLSTLSVPSCDGSSATLVLETDIYTDNAANPGGTGYIAVDANDVNVGQTLALDLETCE